MVKSLKIGREIVPVKHKDLSGQDRDGEYFPETNHIEMHTNLGDNYDCIMIHEIVHAVQENTSLRHTSIPDDVWEVIAHEVSVAISDNFILIPKK